MFTQISKLMDNMSIVTYFIQFLKRMEKSYIVCVNSFALFFLRVPSLLQACIKHEISRLTNCTIKVLFEVAAN